MYISSFQFGILKIRLDFGFMYKLVYIYNHWFLCGISRKARVACIYILYFGV